MAPRAWLGWLASMALPVAGCATGRATPLPETAEPPVTMQVKTSGPPVWVESFDSLPAGWVSPSEASQADIERVFSLGEDDGNAFLQVSHDGAQSNPPPAVHWGRRFENLKLVDACHLSWRWRVRKHPGIDDGDPWIDLAASIYVVLTQPQVLRKGEGFKLGWLQWTDRELTRQLGLVQREQRVSRDTDQWFDEHVDLCKLYWRYYGDPKDVPLVYVGVVTDGDNTESHAAADYDDFRLAPTPPTSEDPP